MHFLPRSFDSWFTRGSEPGKALAGSQAFDPSQDDFELKLKKLSDPQRKAVERVIALARLDLSWHAEELPGSAGEAYAYRSAHGAVHWGLNREVDGPSIACGALPGEPWNAE